MHGGLCVDRGLDYVCSCPKDFMGDRCESAGKNIFRIFCST